MWALLVIEIITVLFIKDIGKQTLYTGQDEEERRQTDVCCPEQTV